MPLRTCVPQPTCTGEEMSQLSEVLNLAGTKPAILSLIAPYSDQYIPKSSLRTFPVPLISLHQPLYAKVQYDELLAECEQFH